MAYAAGQLARVSQRKQGRRNHPGLPWEGRQHDAPHRQIKEIARRTP